MKYYETNYLDYINSLEKYNLHEYKKKLFNKIPSSFNKLSNFIFNGPSGSGKYSQVLNIIKNYSDSNLKYDKKITCYYEKQNYTYKISDIHYEIDISQLGCNSKQLWHDIFFQIVDIITIKPRKEAIIMCYNFHTINNELLDTFYSYMQHCKINPNINIKFFLITEHVSFLPHNIINSSIIINFKRPSIQQYKRLYTIKCENDSENDYENDSENDCENDCDFIKRLKKGLILNNNSKNIFEKIDANNIINIKDFKYFDLIKNDNDIPSELFDIIINKLIDEIINFKTSSFINIREHLYDLLTYNIDIYESIWYIFYYLINNNFIDKNENILKDVYSQLKYYNNNYRPIYHLERIFYNIVIKIHNL